MVRAIEERPIHRSVPVGLSVAVKQKGDEVVTFAVERREEVDEQAQHGGSQEELLIATLQLAEDTFEEIHGSGKVERHQSANDSESQIGWDAIDREGVLQMELEDGIGAGNRESETHSRHTRDEQRQKAGHGQVQHQHFEHKDEAGYRGFEDASNGSSSSATYQKHHVLIGESANLTKTATYRAASQDDRRLGSHTTAKTNRNGRSRHGSPGIMGFDATLFAGNGKENLRDAMTYVVSNDVFDEEHRQPNADDGIDEVEPVGASLDKLVRQ